MSKQIPDAEFIGGGANAAEYWKARAEKAERLLAEWERAEQTGKWSGAITMVRDVLLAPLEARAEKAEQALRKVRVVLNNPSSDDRLARSRAKTMVDAALSPEANPDEGVTPRD